MEFKFLWDDVPEDKAHESLKELCMMMVEEASKQDEMLLCTHTWSYDDERDGSSDERVRGTD